MRQEKWNKPKMCVLLAFFGAIIGRECVETKG
jgi:hypothetical protein